jgi:hypothetical protein
MKNDPFKAKPRKTGQPFEVIKVGSISTPIYAHTNIIPQRDAQTGGIRYENQPDGNRKAVIKYESVIYKQSVISCVVVHDLKRIAEIQIRTSPLLTVPNYITAHDREVLIASTDDYNSRRLQHTMYFS